MATAYAYTAIYSRTLHSDKPTTLYVLEPTFWTAILTGEGGFSTSNQEEFRKMLEEKRKQGLNIITGRKPSHLKSIEHITLKDSEEDFPSNRPVKSAVIRRMAIEDDVRFMPERDYFKRSA